MRIYPLCISQLGEKQRKVFVMSQNQIVFSYIDLSLEDRLVALRAKYPVDYYPDNVALGSNQTAIWIVEKEEDRNQWPMNGNPDLLVLPVYTLDAMSILHHAESRLKEYCYI
jgi:hypothetical protein